ncbi:VOC family protein [Kitasatospora cheerisanensis]|uniref:Hydrolase n=1 Tax=Kitasatospora cheerisanensis KCTC 2395 TaxID=1348663 RepID=A0A066Z1C2_9ACTN|nr:VOC family protein [Kitasatospora cheerisanensis]KDN83980.1 hydrolase [Kitasatospora cheerisanensis KCTC 2395]
MAAQPEGTPVWADAMFTDLEGAKSFYGEVLGWTFGESSTEYGDYTQAYRDGKAVAAIVPPMPGQGPGQSAWVLYLASVDVNATAARIREAGGALLLEPMQVGTFGSMAIAKDPAGVVFGIWQGGDHAGFELRDAPGSYGWAEVFTRDTAAANAFFPKVFPYKVRKLVDDNVDYSIFHLADTPVLGSMGMTPQVPAEVSSFISVYFVVDGCDAAAERVAKAGGQLVFGPITTPFGRFASFVDPQGAAFSLIDPAAAEGEPPATVEVA